MQVSQKGKKGDGGEDGGSHLEPDDLMGLTVSQHVSLRVSATLINCPHLLHLLADKWRLLCPVNPTCSCC